MSLPELCLYCRSGTVTEMALQTGIILETRTVKECQYQKGINTRVSVCV